MDDALKVRQMLAGNWLTQALYVVAKLRVPDALHAAPKTADELAAVVLAHPRALYRLLRSLTGSGIFLEDEQHRFSLTPMGECLRSDVPGSQWARAVIGGDMFYAAWGELLGAVKTGEPAFNKSFGEPLFDFLSKRPDTARLFDDTMVGVHGRETAAIVEALDCSAMRVVADVGGGKGGMIAALLAKHAHLRGMHFDLPGVAERAAAAADPAVASRCDFVGGSFFDSVPAGADAYLLRHVIHDWSEERSTLILRNIGRVMGDDARIYVIEDVVPPNNGPSVAKMLDVAMLVLTGGEERTEREYEALYAAAGLELTRVIPTSAGVSLIEGRRSRG